MTIYIPANRHPSGRDTAARTVRIPKTLIIWLINPVGSVAYMLLNSWVTATVVMMHGT